MKEPKLKVLEYFAKRAGDNLLKEFRKRRIEKRQHGKDIKTISDKVSDNLIKSMIKKRYQNHSILTEETGFLKRDEDYLWIVDPLDGSSNFVNSNPFFSVSIAFLEKGELKFGAIYAPFLGEMFIAENGKGAFLVNERRIAIHVSKINNIKNSYLVTCEGGERNRERIAEIYKRLASKAIDMRKLGSGALECAWVACGRSDAYITTKISPWDVAAGILLVKEAGGRVSDFYEREWDYKKRQDLIISNGRIHKQIVSIVKGCK